MVASLLIIIMSYVTLLQNAWLDKVCYDVATEPPLQQLTGEEIVPATGNQQDEVHTDIHARGFWGQRQGAFFDVRVFHPNAPIVIITQSSHPSINAISRRRRGVQ